MTDMILYPANYTVLELHLSSAPLSARLTKLIKAVGGSYTKCLGNQMKRFVKVPASEEALINELVKNYAYYDGKTTAVARFEGHETLPAWVSVQTLSAMSENPAGDFRRLFDHNRQRFVEKYLKETV